MATSADESRRVPAVLHAAAERHGADLLHLNLPSQAAGCPADLPRIVVSHSCVHTWWRSVHGNAAPREWAWQWQANRDGFDAAGVTLAPTASHARALQRSEERRVGKECVSTCSSRWSTYPSKKKRPVVHQHTQQAHSIVDPAAHP